MMNVYECDGCDKTNNISKILNNTMTHLTMTYPGFLNLQEKEPYEEMLDVIKNYNRVGSLSFTINMLSNSNINVKNLLTIDAWRIFDKMDKNWHSYVMQKINPLENISIKSIIF